MWAAAFVAVATLERLAWCIPPYELWSPAVYIIHVTMHKGFTGSSNVPLLCS